MTEEDLQRIIDKKELELDALLEITQAINSNVSENSLYKIFNFTIRGNLKLTKMALYVFDKEWNCRAHFGTAVDFSTTPLAPSFVSLEGEKNLIGEAPPFDEFDAVISVAHKKQNLALVFIGGPDCSDAHEREETVKFIKALSNIIMVAVENKKLARRQLQQESLRKELEIASDVQQFLFPKSLPYTARLKVEASYLPHAHVGGDYYDYLPIDENRFLICVADVSGKGIPAALLMSNFQASLHTLLRQTADLTEIVHALNYQVFENTKGEKFITFFAAVYDYEKRKLSYVNAGHNPPLLMLEKELLLLEEGAMVLGVMEPLPFLNVGEVNDLERFTLFSYTDGLTETMNEKEEEFGEENILKYLESNRGKDLKLIHQEMITALDLFTGKRSYMDDITLLSCRVEKDR